MLDTYIGLLTDRQKKAGYFINQDADFIYLFYANSGNPDIIAIFNFETATVKEIREEAEKHLCTGMDSLVKS